MKRLRTPILKSIAVLLSVAISLAFLIPIPVDALGASPAELDFVVEPGGQSTLSLHVVNDENETQRYRIYADDEHKNWFQIIPEEISLTSQQTAEIEITVVPPANTIGKHTAFIFITSAEPTNGFQLALGIKIKANIAINAPVNGVSKSMLFAIIAGSAAAMIAGIITYRRKQAIKKIY